MNKKTTLLKKKEIKTELNVEIKTQVSSAFLYPRKKPIRYKVSSKEVKSSKVLNKKDFERAKETIDFIKQKKME